GVSNAGISFERCSSSGSPIRRMVRMLKRHLLMAGIFILRCTGGWWRTCEKGPAFAGPSASSPMWRRSLPAAAAATAAATRTTAEATATAAARTTAEAAAAATTACAGLVLGFVDAQRATIHREAVERLDGARGISLRHFDETETAGAAGFPVSGQRDGLDRAVLREQRTHLSFVGRERQVAYIDLRHKKQISNHQLTDYVIGRPFH